MGIYRKKRKPLIGKIKGLEKLRAISLSNKELFKLVCGKNADNSISFYDSSYNDED